MTFSQTQAPCNYFRGFRSIRLLIPLFITPLKKSWGLSDFLPRDFKVSDSVGGLGRGGMLYLQTIHLRA